MGRQLVCTKYLEKMKIQNWQTETLTSALSSPVWLAAQPGNHIAAGLGPCKNLQESQSDMTLWNHP